MITLAFYKGRGRGWFARLQDCAIRTTTGGIYSHCELIEGVAVLGQSYECLSASARDGGVRVKQIRLNTAHWDLVTVDVDATKAADFIRQREGARYDYLGIVFSQIFAFGWHNPRKWFCSEICAAAIGLRNPQRISPAQLYDLAAVFPIDLTYRT